MLPLLLLIALGAGALLLSEPAAPVASAQAPLPKWQDAPASQKEAEARQAFLRKLRPDASVYADGYSQATYYVQSNGKGAWVPSKAGAPNAMYIDDWGRLVSGVSGAPLGLALQAAGIALPFIPGVGPAASATLAAAVAWAKGESLKDAALKAARAAVPGGAAGQLAFDVGVAVASGRPVDEAAAQALVAQIPGGESAYQAGQDAWAMAQGMGV